MDVSVVQIVAGVVASMAGSVLIGYLRLHQGTTRLSWMS